MFEANVWKQLHTNGATTTFGRWREAQEADGSPDYIFEKMSVDHVDNTQEMHDVREHFPIAEEAAERLFTAVARGY